MNSIFNVKMWTLAIFTDILRLNFRQWVKFYMYMTIFIYLNPEQICNKIYRPDTSNI